MGEREKIFYWIQTSDIENCVPPVPLPKRKIFLLDCFYKENFEEKSAVTYYLVGTVAKALISLDLMR